MPRTSRASRGGFVYHVLQPSHWTYHVNGVQAEAELKSLRHSLALVTPNR